MSIAALASRQSATNQRKDEAAFYDEAKTHYENIGATFDTTANYRNVLAVRVQTPISQANRLGLYDDFIWVLWISGDDTKHATQYEANTEPSKWYEGRDGQDGDNDGRLDLGRLPSGIYKYSTTTVARTGLGNVFRLTAAQRVERDINHDGYFTEADTELIKNEAAMSEGRTMHIHRGNRGRTASAGCQTMRGDMWTRFVADITAGRQSGQSEFTYVLINQ